VTDPRRDLPSVRALLEGEAGRALRDRAPRSVLTDAIRDAVAAARLEPRTAPRDAGEWKAAIASTLAARQRSSLRRVHNATGVVLHTNLGRAPLPDVALAAIEERARGYATLEYDIARGVRGSRYVHCAALLRELTGAEDALVVNNGAAALMLALNTFGAERDSLISRGELIEIGGSFRVPDIMSRSGTTLVEVGTTNRTHARDYIEALSQRSGTLVKVHRSNFSLAGFVAEVPVAELATLAAQHGLASIFDLGSGLLLSLEAYGLHGEPLAADAVRSGATVVTMSGDKLLGGPQAGILLGSAASIDRLKRNPMTRAVRVDKLTLAALEATLLLYREPDRALREIPTLRMLTSSAEEVRTRAGALAAVLRKAGIACDVVATAAAVGGGAFPTLSLESFGVALPGDARRLEECLRLADMPVIGRITEDRLLIDLRSIPEQEDDALSDALRAALA
jgi:L-seryl-tRNA(Ser) seleniumtransferase